MERVLTVAHVVRLMPHLFGGLCLHCGSVMHEILIDACTHLQQRFNNPANDKLSHARERVDDVKGIMIDNIGVLQYIYCMPTFWMRAYSIHTIMCVIFATAAKILERGEQLDILVEQSAQLTTDANDFKYEADDLRKRMCRQHARMIIILSIVGAV